MKVLLADDHKLVRSGIRRLLEELSGVVVVGEADNGRHAAELLASSTPDIVIADISMPVMSGLELSAWIARNSPEIKVIILSMHTAEDYVTEALGAGARGYLLKESAVDEIGLAIEAVAAGNVYLSPDVSRRMVDLHFRKSSGEQAGMQKITQRQREVLKLVAQGKSTKEIAALLGISPRTVDTHRADLMERLGARDAIGLLREAARLGLVDLGKTT